MARYTGPNNKRARRVNFSILESGKDMAKDLMVQVSTEKIEKENHLTIHFNFKKSKKLNLFMV